MRFRACDPEPALFVGVQGKRLSQTIMTQTFLRYARAAGVTERKRVTPHTLRHVFASELLRSGANLRQIQELLGHKHLDSTQRYTRVNAHELRGAVKRLRFPRAAPASTVDAPGRGSLVEVGWQAQLLVCGTRTPSGGTPALRNPAEPAPLRE
jgi:hypothetical protein